MHSYVLFRWTHEGRTVAIHGSFNDWVRFCKIFAQIANRMDVAKIAAGLTSCRITSQAALAMTIT